jgi:hypothetical protein
MNPIVYAKVSTRFTSTFPNGAQAALLGSRGWAT